MEIPGEGCAVPEMKPFGELTEIEKLPDPFTMLDGTKVTTKAQWACRHRELRALFEHYETGPKAVKAATVSGSVSNGKLTVDVAGGEEDVSFSVDISYPQGDGPFPAMIGLAGGSLDNNKLKQLGVAIINYSHSGIQPEGNREGGVFPKFHGNPGTGSLMSWAWGVSRLIDALEKTPDAKIKADRLGITGCSRNGKGALMIGAMDSRIALTIPQESGSGGTAAWRVSEVENKGEQGDGAGIQNLERTYEEQRWFSAAIEQFGRTADVRKREGGLNPKLNFLPVDHHELIMLGAPRGMLILGNLNYTWLSVNNADQAAWAARTLYKALGVEQNIGYVESGHMHCVTDYGANEQQAIDAFVKKFLLDDASASTDFWAPKNGSQLAEWADWEAPATLE